MKRTMMMNGFVFSQTDLQKFFLEQLHHAEVMLQQHPYHHYEPLVGVTSLFLGFVELTDEFWVKSIRIGIIVLGALVLARIILASIDKLRAIRITAVGGDPMDPGVKRVETISSILRNCVMILLFVITSFTILSEIGINIAPLLAGAGIAGIAIGFGAQSLVKDLFYGFFILFENQFGIGDVIQVGNSSGVVEKMTLRTVSLRDLDGRVHIIPNGNIVEVIVATKDWSRMNLNLQVAYKSDLDKVFQVIEKLSKKFYKEHQDLLLEEPSILGVENLGPDGVDIKVVAKTLPLKQWDASRLYRKAVKEAFDKAGIEIPFPQRSIHLASGEFLLPAVENAAKN